MGYVGHKKSVRAFNAEKEGRFPKSRFTKDKILSDIELSGATLEQLTLISKAPVGALRDYFLESYGEWHHTGKYFRETDYYGVEFVPEEFDEKDFIEFIKKFKKEEALKRKQKKEEEGKRAFCKYLVWTRKNNSKPRPKEYREEGIIKGSWFYLDDGTKKSINSNGFEILKYLD